VAFGDRAKRERGGRDAREFRELQPGRCARARGTGAFLFGGGGRRIGRGPAVSRAVDAAESMKRNLFVANGGSDAGGGSGGGGGGGGSGGFKIRR